MNISPRETAGFMSAESLYSLAFYIVMVAAIAGVGAAIMSRQASAKAVAAVSILRANYQAEVSMMGYGAQPTGPQLEKLSHGLLTAAPGIPAATLIGVGIYSITVRTNPIAFSINVGEITNPEVCKAVGSVGWGSWNALHKGILLSNMSIPSSPATPGPLGSGVITSKNQLITICNAATSNTFVQMTLISN